MKQAKIIKMNGINLHKFLTSLPSTGCETLAQALREILKLNENEKATLQPNS